MKIVRLFDNNFYNVVFIIFIIIIVFFIIVYLTDLLTRYYPVIRKFFSYVVERMYVILVPIPVIYLIYFYSNYNEGILQDDFIFQKDVAEILEKLSIWFFTVGIFSATLKYLNTIAYVRKKFKEIVLSKEFDEKLSEKLEILAYSDDFLQKHNNIEDIWERVTLFKYKSEFPLIYPKLKEKINNSLFNKHATPFYYNHFCITIDIKLVSENSLEITTSTRYSIMRPSIEEFEWNFFFKILKSDYVNLLPSLELKFDDGEIINFDEKNSKIEENGEYMDINFEHSFKGKHEYHIRTKRKVIQNIDNDRIIMVGSSRIIDYFDVTINCSPNLNYVFSESNQNKFEKETFEDERTKFTHSKILLPGEIFKVFLIRNN